MIDHATDREIVLEELRRDRPRSAFVRWSVVLLLILGAWSLVAGEFAPGNLFSERRLRNLDRFLAELRPHPLQGTAWEWDVALRWLGSLLRENGFDAAVATLAISVAAIVIAGIAGAVVSLPAARTFATSAPWLPSSTPAGSLRSFGWRLLAAVTRAILVFLRAIPEYVWAFLFIAMLGPDAWPAVLALAIHNAGILGKLNAEVVENLPPGRLSALRGVGATRLQVAIAGIVPLSLSRYLLFFFYRWETCVREATALGMLGIVSLGFFVQDARARQHYDVMFTMILIGSVLVIVGDLVSAVAREIVRRSR